MKKGISIWSFDTGVTFGTGNLDNVFALAKDAGFDGVELALAVNVDYVVAIISLKLPYQLGSAVAKLELVGG